MTTKEYSYFLTAVRKTHTMDTYNVSSRNIRSLVATGGNWRQQRVPVTPEVAHDNEQRSYKMRRGEVLIIEELPPPPRDPSEDAMRLAEAEGAHRMELRAETHRMAFRNLGDARIEANVYSKYRNAPVTTLTAEKIDLYMDNDGA